MTDKIVQLPMGKVIPTPDNPRTVKETDQDVLELAESIRNAGLLVPVLCRKHPKKKGFYDLRAGERRYLAHKVIKAKTILAIVRDLDDKTAMEVTVLENLQREDLTPLEEGKAVKALLGAGGSLREIAAQVGKSHQWVARRARLADIIPGWVKLFEQYKNDAGTMELIARYDADQQKTLLEQISPWSLGDHDAKKSLERDLQELTHGLASVPWAWNDYELVPEAGSCATCEKRTGAMAQVDLFHDTDNPAAVKKAERCLDPECWKKKEAAALAKKEAELAIQFPDFVKIATTYENRGPGVLSPSQYERTKKNTKGAVPALIVAGGGTGTMTWVKKPEYDQDQTELKPRSMADKRKELNAKRWCETVVRFRKTLADTPIDKLDTWENAIYLAATFGTGGGYDGERETFDMLRKRPGDQRLPAAAEILWESVRDVLAGALAYYGPVTQFPDDHVEEAREIAGWIHYDIEALFQAVCQEKGFTEPKCWAEEQAKKAS